ncbi:MAG: DNA replication/repair protein RecF [Acidobacteria bacterium]|nr:DNA replication/repair protein RecF [Acidobacteriota bacterium]
MHLQRIEASNFRNLIGEVEFSPGLNVIYGANAQGKTNWLEAIYLLATTKSFRTSHPREVVAHDAKEAILRGTVARGNLTKDLQLLVTESTKQTFVNGKREAVARYLGALDAIAFTSDEMQIVRGAPEARRRFLDRGVFFTLPAYLGTLNEYNRVLKQKNALLREASDAEDQAKYFDLIQPWNDQLVALGAEIHAARLNYVEQLRAHLKPELFQAEQIAIRYKSSLEGKGDLNEYANLLRERLNLRLKNEIAVGYSLVGPHRDDLEILFDGYEIARFGSSGQQRSSLLILDLAQISVYYQCFEEYPIFLIDDIDAELDRTRIEILLDYLDGRLQTIVSTSKRTIADRYRHRARTLFIRSGRAIDEEIADDGSSQDGSGQEVELIETAQVSDEDKHRAPF